MRLNKDVICGSAIAGVGIILYVEATRSIGKLGYDVLDSPFFPKLGAVMLIIFGGALAFSSFWKPTESKKIQVNNPGRVVSYITLLVLYSLSLHRIGFIFSTVFFFIAGYLIISKHRKIKDFLYSIVFAFSTTIILWLVFVKGLKLLLA
ncbi:MAG: tripartite tricarboxylate transporter TctB family protein [Planctomycetota bacterium]|jgi:hypothetical protein